MVVIKIFALLFFFFINHDHTSHCFCFCCRKKERIDWHSPDAMVFNDRTDCSIDASTLSTTTMMGSIFSSTIHIYALQSGTYCVSHIHYKYEHTPKAYNCICVQCTRSATSRAFRSTNSSTKALRRPMPSFTEMRTAHGSKIVNRMVPHELDIVCLSTSNTRER